MSIISTVKLHKALLCCKKIKIYCEGSHFPIWCSYGLFPFPHVSWDRKPSCLLFSLLSLEFTLYLQIPCQSNCLPPPKPSRDVETLVIMLEVLMCRNLPCLCCLLSSAQGVVSLTVLLHLQIKESGWNKKGSVQLREHVCFLLINAFTRPTSKSRGVLPDEGPVPVGPWLLSLQKKLWMLWASPISSTSGRTMGSVISHLSEKANGFEIAFFIILINITTVTWSQRRLRSHHPCHKTLWDSLE